MSHPPDIHSALAAKRCPPEAALDQLPPGADAIVGLGNGEPVTVIDAIENGAETLRDVRLHQMLPLRDRRYIDGEIPNLHHVSWFLSPHNRDAFHAGHCDLVPNNFSEVPALMRATTKRTVALAAAAPPDRHGYFSLGPHAEYVAPLIGEVPFFLEANPQLPRTFGENQVHVSQIAGWCEADYPLVEVPPREATETDTQDRRARGRADPRRGHDPGRDRLGPRPGPAPALRSSRARRPHGADERRLRRSDRARSDHRHPQGDPSATR